MRRFFLPLLLFAAQLLPAQVSWNVTLEGSWVDTIRPTGYNDVWGYARGGREYAILGAIHRHYILDVTDPQEPVLVDSIPQQFQFATHRDMKTYGDHLYMVSENDPFGLMVADLSHLPDSAPIVYQSTAFFTEAHNIFVDTGTAMLYVFAPSDTHVTYSGVMALSLADPAAPAYAGEWQPATGYSHDGYARNDTLYVNSWDQGLRVVDFTDPSQPTPIAAYPFYPGSIANHSGWLDPERGIYAMADEALGGSRIKILDASDYHNLRGLASFWPDAADTTVTPHNLMFRDEFLYIASYSSGLRIFNTALPGQPVLVGHFDTDPRPLDGFTGAWGIYSRLPSGRVLVSDREFGLHIFDPARALVAVGAPQALEAQVGPVPAAERVYFRTTGAAQGSYRLLDQDGRTVREAKWRGRGNDVAVRLEDLPPGMYFLEITARGKSPARHKLIHY